MSQQEPLTRAIIGCLHRAAGRWQSPRLRFLGALAAAAAATVLAACGGGVSIGIGYDGAFDFSSPSVSLAAAQSSVRAGQPVDLVAAAADESGIESVEFYRRDDDRVVLLGTDGNEPFQWQATAPADGRTSVRLFARANDRAGNWADSETVTVTVTP